MSQTVCVSSGMPVEKRRLSFGSFACGAFLILAAVSAVTAHGEGWYWRGTAQDTLSAEKDGSGKPLWENQKNPGTYGLPTTSDTAILNNGSTATLRTSDETFVNQLQGIYIHDSASTMIVDVGDNETLSIGCTLSGNGLVRKAGGGIFRLTHNSTNTGSDNSYFLSTAAGEWVVEEGTLATPNYNSSYVWSSNRYFGRMTVKSGAVLAIGTQGQNIFKGLWGDGTVTNSLDGTANCIVYIWDDVRTGRSVFNGKITGTVRFMCEGKIDFTGATSDYTGDPSYKSGSDIGVMLFGATDSSTGSLGSAAIKLRGANIAFRYLGENGETTARNFSSGGYADIRSLTSVR